MVLIRFYAEYRMRFWNAKLGAFQVLLLGIAA